MTLIPSIKFYSDDTTDVVYTEVILKTLPVGPMIHRLTDIIDCYIELEGKRFDLNGSNDKEHWYMCRNYKELQLIQSVRLKVLLPYEILEFNDSPMHLEHISKGSE